MLYQYNNINASSYKYLKEKKSINERLKKKKVSIVATVLLGTVATIQNLKKKKKTK